MTLHVGPLPAGDERHLKAHKEAAIALVGSRDVWVNTGDSGLRRLAYEQSEAIVAAYFAQLRKDGVRLVVVTPAGEDALRTFVGDEQHPDWTAYVAGNLLQVLRAVPDTGDWHAAVSTWCERNLDGPVPERSVRLVDASEVAEWLRTLPGLAHRSTVEAEFLARFGGGDER